MGEFIAYPEVIDFCGALRTEADCDFIGLAIQNRVGPDIKWLYVIGNRNDKYKHITVRYGKGIAGRVIATGSTMMVEDFPNGIQGKSLEYPIMLAEKLVAAYAVPIFHTGTPKGVLLAGKRNHYQFTEQEQQLLKSSALKLADLIKNQLTL